MNLHEFPLQHGWVSEETNQEFFAEGTRNGQSCQEHTSCLYSLHQTAYIVDLLAIIQMLSKGKMKTFEELSDTIAGTIMANFKFASQVHIAPDRCDVEDSTKSGERSRRSQRTAIEIKIQSREMKLPTSLKRYLCSGKTNLSC